MAKFKSYDYNQTSMVVINFEEQLQPGTFEHAIHYLIDERLDLSVFHPQYKNDEGGRPAYDPAILLKIILFAYSKGITSSREIQWCCETNIIFKALSCDTVPHFTTIASFVSSYPESIEALFEQIVLICDQEGLIGNELFAIDGCKLPSNAAKEWSGTLDELKLKRDKIRKKIRHCIKEHKKLDRRRSDDKERARRLEKSITTLDKAFNKIDQFLKTASPRMGKAKQRKEVKSNITDNESAKITSNKGTFQGYNGIAAVDKKHQIIVEARAFGEGQEYHTLRPMLEGIRERYQRLGLSDNIYQDGTIVTADTGYASEDNMQYLNGNGIDAYVPDNQFRLRDKRLGGQKQKHGPRHPGTAGRGEIYPASRFWFNATSKTCVCPAGNAMWLRSEKMDAHGNTQFNFEGRLTDCRHCPQNSQCMHNPSAADDGKGNGRQVRFTLKTKPSATDWMKRRIDSKRGKEIYGHRMSVVEPVFGNLTANKGLNRFSLRGKAKVQGQWQLFCMIQNIEKIMRYGASMAS